MPFFPTSEFAGFNQIAMPHFQARLRKLYERYNNARSGETIILEGKLLVDRIGVPILGWEFDAFQSIPLIFGEFNWRPFKGKSIQVTGQKLLDHDLSRLKNGRQEYRFFYVKEIIEKEFDWKEELSHVAPDISNLGEFISESNYPSSYEEPYKAFILSLIGLSKTGEPSGIGLSTFIPQGYSSTSFEPLIKMYGNLDPFKLKTGLPVERFSQALYATLPKAENVVRRDMGFQEVDYLLGTKPGMASPVVNRLISFKSELLTTIGEEGLEKPKIHREDYGTLQYAIFYDNKCITPILTKEGRQEIEVAQIRLMEKLNRETTIEYSPLSEVIARTKLENTAIALAKANHVESIGENEIQAAEDLQKSLLTRLVIDPSISNALFEKSKSMREEIGAENYRAIKDVRQRIMIELMIAPREEKELVLLLRIDFDENLVKKVITDMHQRGEIYYDAKGKINLSRKL